jgi:hypothetical protein
MDYQSMPVSTVAEFLDAGRHAFAEGKAGSDCPYSESEDILLRHLWEQGYCEASMEANGLQVPRMTPD